MTCGKAQGGAYGIHLSTSGDLDEAAPRVASACPERDLFVALQAGVDLDLSAERRAYLNTREYTRLRPGVIDVHLWVRPADRERPSRRGRSVSWPCWGRKCGLPRPCLPAAPVQGLGTMIFTV